MIQIADMPFEQDDLWPSGSVEKMIIQRMNEDPTVYKYPSIEELWFEIKIREQIIQSARAMNQSEVAFEPFERTRCNPRYWVLMNTGGLQLRPDVKPSNAIEDIYRNSSQYAFECATAIIIIYYYAVLNSINESVFNKNFQNIYLYSWNFDSDLGIHTIHTRYFLPGDVIYVNNPDFHPETPWWRGENAVVLEDGTYFGHGLGIQTVEEIIMSLNSSRSPDSTQSAYLTRLVTRPSFKDLMKFEKVARSYFSYKFQHVVIHHNESSIPSERYLFYLNQLYSHMSNPNPFL